MVCTWTILWFYRTNYCWWLQFTDRRELCGTAQTIYTTCTLDLLDYLKNINRNVSYIRLLNQQQSAHLT